MTRTAPAFRRFATFALAAATLAGLPGIANAATLRYGDLDLATTKGQGQLERRIERTAFRYCTAEVPTASRLPSTECMAAVRSELHQKLALRDAMPQRMAAAR